MSKTDFIDGVLLRRDRDEQGLSRIALLARIEELDGPSIAESTLRRAEDGISSAYPLKWISQALGYPPERYRLGSAATAEAGTTDEVRVWKPSFNLSGAWRVYYLEDDVDSGPYVCVERLSVAQEGAAVSGTYLPISTEHPHGYVGTDAFKMRGLTSENVVLGRYYREDVAHAQGAGVFQLVVGRAGAWAEGACTFFGDDGRVMVSLNLWIREDSPQFVIMKKQAEALFAKHKLMWKLPISGTPALSM